MIQIWKRKIKYICGILLLLCFAAGCAQIPEQQDTGNRQDTGYQQDTGNQQDADYQQKTEDNREFQSKELQESGSYTTKEDVAAYLHEFNHLPYNFITKKEAKKLGWVSSEGNLSEAAPGKSIGGDRFGNYEGTLPEKEGRQYYECDIDSDGGYRGAKRIVYSNDGLIYYTEDHYETFELLYGEVEP